jgi:hypothetical protein
MPLPFEEWTFLPDGVLSWMTTTQFLGRLSPGHPALSGFIRQRVLCVAPSGARREFDLAAASWTTIFDLIDQWTVNGYRYELLREMPRSEPNSVPALC